MLIHWYRLANWLWRHKVPFLPRLIYLLQYILFNCSVHASCTLGKGTKFGYYGMAVVIHSRAVIGKNCVIGTCVTIGGRSKHIDVPVIGDNVYIGTGAKILGPIKIGNNVVIGAGAVVISDIPDNSVAVGMPAKVVKTGIDVKDFC